MSAFAKPTYCYECALTQRPEPAVGYDIDGEPACAVHRAPQVGETDFAEVKRKAQPEASAAQKEKPAMKARVCKCGCGGSLSPTNNWEYLKGHKPKKGDVEVREVSGGLTRVPILTDAGLRDQREVAVDRMIVALPLERKVEILKQFLGL